MNSKQIISMSKLGKKKVPSINSSYDGNDLEGAAEVPDADDKLPTMEAVPAGMKLPTANQVGSMDILKATKAADLSKIPSSDVIGDSAVPSTNKTDSGVFLKSKKVPYSPIKNYLKGRK